MVIMTIPWKANRDDLTQVHDVYGRRLWVLTSELNEPTITFLHRYHPRTLERYREELGDKPGERIVHRGNICPHPLSTFVHHRVFGELTSHCPVCYNFCPKCNEEQPAGSLQPAKVSQQESR